MDSRGKIVAPAQALEILGRARSAGQTARLVIGHFDPLLPAHGRRLAEIAAPGGLLVVLVTDPPDPILPTRARAELVAALRVIDWVLLGDSTGVEELIGQLETDQVFCEEAADLRRAEDFRSHVRARQGG